MLKNIILKYALQNAIKYNGKANVGAVLGKVLSENPDLRNKAKELKEETEKIVKDVNSLSVEKQRKRLEALAPELLKEKKIVKKHELPALEGAEKGKVVMRFEPSPSGPLHIGHAYTLSLNSEYCRKYNGKLIVRIADTNPEKIYKKAYKLIPKDAQWVTKNNIKTFIIQSDRLKLYYKHAEELIKKGHAYVCTCKKDDFREAMLNSIPCPCRHLTNKTNLERLSSHQSMRGGKTNLEKMRGNEHFDRWKNMFSKYQEGEAVVRIKTDLTNKNPAMRDWPALRINHKEHPKQLKKYKVWPLMNFAVAIDDHELGITHTIRAKEHIDNEKRQKYIYDYLNWKMPKHLYIGRINFTDLKVSCSKTRPLIEKGIYSGWDDIRLPFLEALRRRGYKPEAFIKYALDVGVSQNDKLVSAKEFFKVINAFNKDVIDSKAYRYFFVENPVEIKVKNAPKQDIELDLHPDNKKGGRKFKTKDRFYITKEDYQKIKNNKLVRLMDCLNFIKRGNTFIFDSLSYKKFREEGGLIIHWLPVENSLASIDVLMPDGSVKKGLGEKALKYLKVNSVVQFERFSFVNLDKKEGNKLIFWFTHK